MSPMLTATIVTYKNNNDELKRSICSFLSTTMDVKLYIIDNSPTDEIKLLCTDDRIEYRFMNSNSGFGKGHNIILDDTFKLGKYHIVLNPDIYFEEGTLEDIVLFMDNNPTVGLLMPKIVNPDGSIRKIRRLLPNPMNIFGKVLAFVPYYKKMEAQYRTEFISYEKAIEVPFVSGCFMFIRTSELEKIGTFDKRFFMYFEDVDLSRRFYMNSKTQYYPSVQVTHIAHRESSKNFHLAIIHIISAIKYFNKWGWLRDTDRHIINEKISS